MISLETLKHVYVSSHQRGFFVISGYPSCVTAHGCSGTHHVIEVAHVVRKDGSWLYENPEQRGELWMKTAFDEAVALKGTEPWRIYRLDAESVGRALDAGVHIDDVRGFDIRLEPWQPLRPLMAEEDSPDSRHIKLPEGWTFATPAEATAWQRRDGWRVILQKNGLWGFDKSGCNADKSILQWSPDHFSSLHNEKATAEEAMAFVDRWRPWS